jgi:hypothetical protein
MKRRRHTHDDASTVIKETATVTPRRHLTTRIAAFLLPQISGLKNTPPGLRTHRAVQAKDAGSVACSARERLRTPACIALCGALILLFVSPAVSSAQVGTPAWAIRSYATPANLPPGGTGNVVVLATNLGAVNANAALNPIVINDTLPPQLEATSISIRGEGIGGQCDLALVSCEASGQLFPYGYAEVRIEVAVANTASGSAPNEVGVSGAGAKAQSSSETVRFSSEPVHFGVQSLETVALNEDGTPATQAGSHPYQYTTTFQMNEESYGQLPGLIKDIRVQLPPGLIGNTTAIPQCTAAQFTTFLKTPINAVNACPDDTVVGVASVRVPTSSKNFLLPAQTVVPIFNMVPPAGAPARFAFDVQGVPAFLDASVRSNGDYGITIASNNTSNVLKVSGVQASFWGVPSAPSHDQARGWSCIVGGRYQFSNAGPCPELSPTRKPGPAFLRLPTSCTGPLTSTVEATSWAEPGNFTAPLAYTTNENGTPYGQDGCNQLPFSPTIFAEPTSDAATSPTGLNFHLDLEDQGLLNAESKGQSDIKKAVVTLPQGFTTNPSVAEGLTGCPEAAFNSSTVNSEPGTGCPEASKIGSVELESPLIDQKLTGSLYVATQHDNPFHNLLTIYMVVANPELGVLVKAPGKVTSDPVTGQLTTTFGEPGHELPQLPASHFRLSFRQGQRSPLITPPACGNYTVNADIYPWSNPSVPIHDESSFAITTGPEGQGCPSGGVPPFHPSLLAGSENPTAGVYSPFYTDISRKDSEQEITHFSIKLPPGVIGKLAGVSECSDAAIAAAKAREQEGGGGEELSSPSCPANSEVGHSNVGTGVGNVLAYAPGKLYLAGPYHGSNLSLVSITAAKVGPFDLGTVVVRFALRIDPETAEVFVDSQGSDPIPHIVDGIPVHLRDIQAFVDRPSFTLNPTNCAKKSTASTVLGSGLNFASAADDQPVTVTSPFQVGSCASLGFKPKLALSLKGGTKRGATPAFKAVLTYPKGSYANIAKSVVTLPHSVFLEQAHIKTVCTRVQFKEGKVPGEKCPAASIYGRASAVTPLLDEPLSGPVYLRSSSHNLPDLVAALHNNQVDFALDGRIDSVEGGRIRNTFETVPDAPVSRFVLEMQGGKKGLLTNSTNLCSRKNRAISEFTGQNGKTYDTNPVLKAQCGKKGMKAKGKGKRRN